MSKCQRNPKLEVNKIKMNWKITGIISITLNVVFILLMLMAWTVGSEMVENEIECTVNVCSMDDAVSYWYDDYTEVCSCFDVYGSEIHTEMIR